MTGVETAPGTGTDTATHGLASAVEMCNSNGHCRKFDAGTMCPSYRVTKDEQHVTRGRANTLRLALTGQLGPGGLAAPEVKAALDLCVSCKGCKRDCPTGVDMAKLKIEARHAWTKQHGIGLRERLVAYLPRYAPFASRVSGMMTIADRAGWLKHTLGWAAERSFPRFKKSFLSNAVSSKAADREVLLFVDSFNNYIDPENAHAAQSVLEAAGYKVHFNINTQQAERPLCCGRTFLAAGLVDQAKEEARRTLDTLRPFVDRGVPIVGLEPSCLLSLRDEFLSYGYGEEARALANLSFLFEEFLVREHRADRWKLPLQPLDTAQVMVHGHCHQKAFDAFNPVLTVLAWIPGLKVAPVESSCCGMAGSFGYEAEHSAVSKAMAELSLLPAVRNRPTGSIVVADGTSCRQQILDGTGVEALHAARVLAMALHGKRL
jgi:Fe-S oxidoreductase